MKLKSILMSQKGNHNLLSFLGENLFNFTNVRKHNKIISCHQERYIKLLSIYLFFLNQITCKRLDHSSQLLAASADGKHHIHDQQHQYMLQQPQAKMHLSISNSHRPGKNNGRCNSHEILLKLVTKWFMWASIPIYRPQM